MTAEQGSSLAFRYCKAAIPRLTGARFSRITRRFGQETTYCLRFPRISIGDNDLRKSPVGHRVSVLVRGVRYAGDERCASLGLHVRKSARISRPRDALERRKV